MKRTVAWQEKLIRIFLALCRVGFRLSCGIKFTTRWLMIENLFDGGTIRRMFMPRGEFNNNKKQNFLAFISRPHRIKIRTAKSSNTINFQLCRLQNYCRRAADVFLLFHTLCICKRDLNFGAMQKMIYSWKQLINVMIKLHLIIWLRASCLSCVKAINDKVCTVCMFIWIWFVFQLFWYKSKWGIYVRCRGREKETFCISRHLSGFYLFSVGPAANRAQHTFPCMHSSVFDSQNQYMYWPVIDTLIWKTNRKKRKAFTFVVSVYPIKQTDVID